jgi:Derlin-2/3
MDLIMGGPGAAAVSVTGAVVGHLWWWVIYGDGGRGLPSLRHLGSAPSWVRTLVSDGVPGAVGAGVHVVPSRQQRGASARTTGYNWGGGAGNRLGSE